MAYVKSDAARSAIANSGGMLMNALKHVLHGVVRWNQIAEDGIEHSPEQRLSLGGAPHGAVKRVRHRIRGRAIVV
jgi:hypothetical protein